MRSGSKTRVYFTVDVECREQRHVAGKLQPAAGYDLRVWGRFRNQNRQLGIGLIMDELERHGFAATMYLDPFGSLHFGRSEFCEVCQQIRERGHDLQVHAHPIQRQGNWISEHIKPQRDKMNEYDRAGQVAILREALDIFVDAGVPRDELTSFRAGHFAANPDTWRAMAEVGLRVSSSFNPCYVDKGVCQIKWEKASGGLFNTGHHVWELPITTFQNRSGHHRHLQLTAVSLAEVIHVLKQARRIGMKEVTIVTHSFEFFHIDDESEGLGRINTLNVKRLRGLSKFLAKHHDAFEVDTAGSLAKRLPEQKVRPVDGFVQGKRTLQAARMIAQAYKRLETSLPALSRASQALFRL